MTCHSKTQILTRERPIIFDGESVRAILAGRKTQTRRVIKHQGKLPDGVDYPARYSMTECSLWHDDYWPNGRVIQIPIRVGDHLWVRETWGIDNCGNRVSLAKEAWPAGYPVDRLRYVADGPVPAFSKRIPIFMPRWAARLWLVVTDVRVQRLHDITGADAIEEGVVDIDNRGMIQAFIDRWDPLNAKRGHPWESNPWVWAYTFERSEAQP